MATGEICARLYSSGELVRLRWVDGVITELQPLSPAADLDAWLAPPLFDLQVNGFAGVDFQHDGLTEGELLTAAEGLRKAGCPLFLLTLMTDRWSDMLARLQHLRQLRMASPELSAAIVGWHLEGPFLSSAPGFCGAHAPEWMIDPRPECIQQVHELTAGDPVLITLAPERTGSLDAIRIAVSLGMRVSLGHTNASAEVLRQAVAAGATGFTHLGNACPQELDRHDNILWRALDTPGLTASLIPDGFHVSPVLFRLAHRLLDPDRIYYTADAVAAAAAPPGRYTVGRHQVDVGPDQIVRQPGKSNYAGSGLRPIDGVFRAARMLESPWQQVWPFFSIQPARFMHLPAGLTVGRSADFCLVQVNQDGELASVRTWVGGGKC